MGKLLIRGGRVIPMTGAHETRADVLIDGTRIVAVEPDITTEAEVIEARDAIVLPGFVDTHRHVWQTQLRTIATDWSLFDYAVAMRYGYSGLYTAEDVYLGNLVGALEALDAGVTTLVDHCHIVNSPDHAEEAARGLQDAGIRAIFCYGTFVNPSNAAAHAPGDHAWRLDTARRLRHGRLSGEGLVRFGFAPFEAEAMSPDDLAGEICFARDLGAAAISCHAAMGPYDSGRAHIVERLSAAGLLGPDLLFVHGAAFSDVELQLIADCGAAISSTPETELQMGMGFPVAWRAQAHNVSVGLGVDIVSNYAGDMFMPMRLGLQASRAQNNEAFGRRRRAPATIGPSAFSALRMATLGGAEAIRMSGQVGSLEPGKRADIAVIDTGAIHMTPAIDAVGAVVLNARPTDISTVLVDGRVVKREGKLVGVNWPALRARLHASAERIVAGFALINTAQTAVAMRAAFPHLE